MMIRQSYTLVFFRWFLLLCAKQGHRDVAFRGGASGFVLLSIINSYFRGPERVHWNEL